MLTTLSKPDNPPSRDSILFLEQWQSWLWLLLPLACHTGFSWIGFNPTDEGWLPAIARRLMEGEVPHRDFISMRPVLSAALQIPLVWMGGEHVFLLLRLWGWLVAGGISWLWSGLLVPEKPAGWFRLVLYGIIFFLNVHVFPVMAWHSLDGLLFATASVTLARKGTAASWRGAFFCGGLAVMCRQNFVFFLPFLIIGLFRSRQWWSIAWAAIPPAVYVLILIYCAALHDFIEQVQASKGMLFDAAVAKYFQTPVFMWGLGAGLVAAFSVRLFRQTRPGVSGLVSAAILTSLGFYEIFCLWQGSHIFLQNTFFCSVYPVLYFS